MFRERDRARGRRGRAGLRARARRASPARRDPGRHRRVRRPGRTIGRRSPTPPRPLQRGHHPVLRRHHRHVAGGRRPGPAPGHRAGRRRRPGDRGAGRLDGPDPGRAADRERASTPRGWHGRSASRRSSPLRPELQNATGRYADIVAEHFPANLYDDVDVHLDQAITAGSVDIAAVQASASTARTARGSRPASGDRRRAARPAPTCNAAASPASAGSPPWAGSLWCWRSS